MGKINFTKEHYAKMKELAFDMLINNETIVSKLGQHLTIVDLLHTQTINILNGIRLSLGNQIDALEKQDTWGATEYQQKKLDTLKQKKELVNLIIGWKRYNLEKQETIARIAETNAKLRELKESQKSPEDKIKELEGELAALQADEEF